MISGRARTEAHPKSVAMPRWRDLDYRGATRSPNTMAVALAGEPFGVTEGHALDARYPSSRDRGHPTIAKNAHRQEIYTTPIAFFPSLYGRTA